MRAVRSIVVILLCTAVLIGGLTVLNYAEKRYLSAAFPLSYTDEVNASAKEFGVSPSLIFAVIYIESRFDPTVESSANARGLMQMTESTFDFVAYRMKETGRYTYDDLFDPQVSIRYGTYLLSYLVSTFHNEETALAAYNAGISVVSQWLLDSDCSADGVHLEHIPYSETENYVLRVVETRKRFCRIYSIV